MRALALTTRIYTIYCISPYFIRSWSQLNWQGMKDTSSHCR